MLRSPGGEYFVLRLPGGEYFVLRSPEGEYFLLRSPEGEYCLVCVVFLAGVRMRLEFPLPLSLRGLRYLSPRLLALLGDGDGCRGSGGEGDECRGSCGGAVYAPPDATERWWGS